MAGTFTCCPSSTAPVCPCVFYGRFHFSGFFTWLGSCQSVSVELFTVFLYYFDNVWWLSGVAVTLSTWVDSESKAMPVPLPYPSQDPEGALQQAWEPAKGIREWEESAHTCVVLITSLYSFLHSSHNVFSLYTQPDTFSDFLRVIWISGMHFSEEESI